MNGFILAAGFGTRMKELTQSMPKPMLPYRSRPLIEYSLCNLVSWGIRDIVINLHYLPEKIVGFINEWQEKNPDIRISLSYEEEILGTAGGIKNGLKLFKDPHQPLVAVNPDTLMFPESEDNPVEAFAGCEGKVLSLLALKPLPENSEESWFYFNADSSLQMILNKDKIHTDYNLSKFYYIGLSVLKPEIFDNIQPFTKAELGPLWKEISQQGRLRGYIFRGKAEDAGSRESYLRIVRGFSNQDDTIREIC